MRCRKVRSYLSAYCNNELSESGRLSVSEHLSTCSSCRKEAAIYISLNKARSETERLKVSDDFNANLLNRIAQERFAETRTQAYLPSTAPRIVWGRAIPAFVTACLVIVVSAVVFSPGIRDNIGVISTASNNMDDSYLTAQPTNNPNLTVNLDHRWSFSDQLARAERLSQLSHSMTEKSGSNWNVYSTNMRQVVTNTVYQIPYVPDYFRIRPVVRVYGAPSTTSDKEVTRVY